eukprot:1285146-Rhodomonas_salina.1
MVRFRWGPVWRRSKAAAPAVTIMQPKNFTGTQAQQSRNSRDLERGGGGHRSLPEGQSSKLCWQASSSKAAKERHCFLRAS